MVGLEKLMNELAELPKPQYIMVPPVPYAMFQAFMDNQGKDRRRIKREVNKAIKRTTVSILKAKLGEE